MLITFRIKSNKYDTLCLTCNRTIDPKYNNKAHVDVRPCIHKVRVFKYWDNIYHSRQLFNLYPLLKAPQKVFGYFDEGTGRQPKGEGGKKCLTYGKLIGTITTTTATTTNTIIIIATNTNVTVILRT